MEKRTKILKTFFILLLLLTLGLLVFQMFDSPHRGILDQGIYYYSLIGTTIISLLSLISGLLLAIFKKIRWFDWIYIILLTISCYLAVNFEPLPKTAEIFTQSPTDLEKIAIQVSNGDTSLLDTECSSMMQHCFKGQEVLFEGKVVAFPEGPKSLDGWNAQIYYPIGNIEDYDTTKPVFFAIPQNCTEISEDFYNCKMVDQTVFQHENISPTEHKPTPIRR